MKAIISGACVRTAQERCRWFPVRSESSTSTYVAPKAERVDAEMHSFLKWFEAPPEMDLVLKAGLAHLWFVTIHPFEDRNGRIAPAIADMALARSENSPQRFYRMSAQIRQERNAYYEMLEETQKGSMDITPWMDWFLGCLGRAISAAQTTLSAVLAKARFWDRIKNVQINERQRLVINRLLDGFEGKPRPRNMLRWASARRRRHTGTFLPWSITAFWFAMPKGAAALAIHFQQGDQENESATEKAALPRKVKSPYTGDLATTLEPAGA